MKSARLLVGALFCITSALLYGMNYMAAAFYLPNINGWDSRVSRLGRAYEMVGHSLQWIALVFFVVGVIYMIAAEKAVEN